MKKKKYLLILLFIIAVGCFLRFAGIFQGSFAFTYDVGRDLLATREIIQTHKILLIGPTTGLPGLFYGPWWNWILLLPFVVFSGNPMGINFFIGLSGIAAVVIGYSIGKKISGDSMGIIFAGFLAVSAPLVATSDQIWSPNLIPFFLILYLLILFVVFSHKLSLVKKCISIIILGFLLGLILDMEIVFGTALIISQLIFFVIAFSKKEKVFTPILLLAGIALTLLPRMFFELRHQFLMTKSILSLFHGSSSGHVSFIGNIIPRILDFFNLWSVTVAGGNQLLGLLLLVLVVGIAVIHFSKFTPIQKTLIKLVGIVFTTYLVIFSFFPHDVYGHYLLGIPVFYLLLISFVFAYVIEKTGYKLLFIAAIVLLFILNVNPVQVIKNTTKPTVGDASYYHNQIGVIKYTYQQAAGKPFKEVVYTPPLHDYTYQYLFSWYGQKTFGYTPVAQAKIGFFVIEPDPGFPMRITDWLKVREGDGKIVKEQILPGGIRVQTRVY